MRYILSKISLPIINVTIDDVFMPKWSVTISVQNLRHLKKRKSEQ